MKFRRISAGYILKICIIVGLQFSGKVFSLNIGTQLSESLDVTLDTMPSCDGDKSNTFTKGNAFPLLNTNNADLDRYRRQLSKSCFNSGASKGSLTLLRFKQKTNQRYKSNLINKL